MTEDEAKTKWCCGPPWVAPALLVRLSHGEITDTSALGRCVASTCMAWRWSPEFREEGPSPPRRVISETNGFCGLAGALP